MNFSEFNKNARLLTLMCLCIGLYIAMTSGTILLFLHPRSVPLVKIAWVILVILTLDDLRTFTKSKTAGKFNWRFLVIFFPIVLAILVKPSGLSSRLAVQKGVSSMALTADRSVPLPQCLIRDTAAQAPQETLQPAYDNNRISQSKDGAATADRNSTKPEAAGPAQESDAQVPSITGDNSSKPETGSGKTAHDTMLVQTATGGIVLMHGHIPPSPVTYTINDDSMYSQIDRLYAGPAKHAGEVITMTGFVAPDTILGRKSFFLARIMITCCAADGMPIGFYCITDSTLGIKENDWIMLTGKIEARSVKFPWNTDEKTIPLLKVITVKKAVRPQNEYVYPAY